MMTHKPRISPETAAKWQKIVDLIARLAGVPSSLIMKVDAPLNAVFVASDHADSPYEAGQSFLLSRNLYCQSVLERDDELVVEDARADPRWSTNDDLQHGMSFYVGLPLKWPDGEAFGTICMLDRHRNRQALLFREGLRDFCQIIETDLALVYEAERRTRAERELQATLADLEQVVAQRTRDLQEANAALRVLISNLENARRDHEEALRRNIRSQIRPGIAKLRQGIGATEPHRTHVEMIENNLRNLLSDRAAGLTEIFERLTPAEVEVAQLVIHGYTTKDIARRMARDTSTIDFHRNNIRRKLNLSRGVNLRSYLAALN